MSPNSRTTRIIGALLTAAMLAACSGNPSTSSLPSTQTPFKWNGKVGKLSIRLKLPSRKRQAEIAKLVARAEAARGEKPHYFPGNATTLLFKLQKINGVSTTPPTPYDFTVQLSSCAASTPFACVVTGGTSAAVDCHLVAGAWSCTINTNAPAAPDTFLIETEDTSSTTKILSQSSLIITVAAGGTPTGSFALDPVVSKMAWDSAWIDDTASYIGTGTGGNSGGGNGPNEPTWTTGVGYTCPSALLATPVFCSDPLVNGNSVVTNDTLTLNFLDADGNIVLPVSGGASPALPIYVNANGNEVNVNVTCNNADLQWLNSTGSAGISYATLSGAVATATPNPGGQTPNPFLANGASSSFSGAMTDFVGNGNPNGANQPQMNSPETGKDGTSGGGTDARGSVISDAIWGNTGAYLNYDGGGNASSGATSWTCTATATASNGSGVASQKYYVGLAEGSISGAKIHPIKIHPHH